MTAGRMPVEHQMLDAAGAPGAWPTHLLVDRLSALIGELDRCRAALDQIARVAKACVINEVETYGKPVGDYDEIQGLAEDALNHTDAQEGTA